MLSWRRLFGQEEPSASPQRQEAEEAIKRAQADSAAVQTRKPEVDWLYNELLSRKHKNNFGPSLALAIERRNAGID